MGVGKHRLIMTSKSRLGVTQGHWRWHHIVTENGTIR